MQRELIIILHRGFPVSNEVNFKHFDDGNKRHYENILLILSTPSLLGGGQLSVIPYVSYIQYMEDGKQCQGIPTLKLLLNHPAVKGVQMNR